MEENAAEARSQAALARDTEDEVSIATHSTDIYQNQPKRDVLDSRGRCHVSGIRRRASWELRSGHSLKWSHASHLPDFIPTLTGLLLFYYSAWSGRWEKCLKFSLWQEKLKKNKKEKNFYAQALLSLKEGMREGTEKTEESSLFSSCILKWHPSLRIPTKYNYFHLPTKNLMSNIPIKMVLEIRTLKIWKQQ